MDDEQLQFGFIPEIEANAVHYIPIGMFLRGFVHAWHDGRNMRYARTSAHKPDNRCPACRKGKRSQ